MAWLDFFRSNDSLLTELSQREVDINTDLGYENLGMDIDQAETCVKAYWGDHSRETIIDRLDLLREFNSK